MKSSQLLHLVLISFLFFASFCSNGYSKSLQVVVPNGGEIYPIGSERMIGWKAEEFTQGSVDLWLIDTVTHNEFLIKNVSPISSPYLWRTGTAEHLFPGIIQPGNPLLIRIKTPDGKYSDESDKPFTFSEPESLTILQPNKFSFWQQNTQHPIMWAIPKSLEGTLDLSIGMAMVPNKYNKTIAKGIPLSQGHFEWNVGNAVEGSLKPGSGYYIQARTSDGIYQARSDFFSIQQKEPTHYNFDPLIKNKSHTKNESGFKAPVPCRMDTAGSVIIQSADEMVVGYENHSYDTGCDWNYQGTIYQSVISFDLSGFSPSKIEKIKTARLELVRKSTKSIDLKVGSCATSLWIMDGPWNDGYPKPMHHYTELPNYMGTVGKAEYGGSNAIVIDVTEIAKSWINKSQANFGLLFIGPDESLTHNNNYCISYYKINLNIYLNTESFL